MSDLRLDLDTTDFKELVELGRSIIPTVAPGWTDHNIHDPGVMLMELVAWVADAEIYALSALPAASARPTGTCLVSSWRGPDPRAVSSGRWPRMHAWGPPRRGPLERSSRPVLASRAIARRRPPSLRPGQSS